jgi:hypothetical protein
MLPCRPQATGNALFSRALTFLRGFSGDGTVDMQLVHGGAMLNEQIVELRDIYGAPGESVASSAWFSQRRRPLLSPYGVGPVDIRHCSPRSTSSTTSCASGAWATGWRCSMKYMPTIPTSPPDRGPAALAQGHGQFPLTAGCLQLGRLTVRLDDELGLVYRELEWRGLSALVAGYVVATAMALPPVIPLTMRRLGRCSALGIAS